MNIGILYIGVGKEYFSLYKDFKKSFDEYFLPNHNKHYFIITDNEYDYTLNNDETRIIIENEGWPYITLKRFEYFLKCNTEGMDYLFYFNGNAICKEKINDNDILPNENDKWLCGLFIPYNILSTNPFDKNKDSACFLDKNDRECFRGGMLGGRRKEFLEMCENCVEMITHDLNINYIPKWNDEAYFNKYVYYLNIKKIKENIASYCNLKHIKTKILFVDKRKTLGRDFLKKIKGNLYYNN